MSMPIGLTDEELQLITALTQPLQPPQRSAFLHQLIDELRAGGAHNPAIVRKLGHRLQARFLGAAPIIGIEDHD